MYFGLGGLPVTDVSGWLGLGVGLRFGWFWVDMAFSRWGVCWCTWFGVAGSGLVTVAYNVLFECGAFCLLARLLVWMA